MVRVILTIALAFPVLSLRPLAVADDQQSADKLALAPLQVVVGQWRGVGQPRRGSSQGAWTVESNWGWRFDGPRASLVCELAQDKYFSRLEVRAGAAPGQWIMLAAPAGADGGTDERPLEFRGEKSDDAFVFLAEGAAAERPDRITFRLVAGGDRLLVLLEKRLGGGQFSRLAEVGSTRQGSSFAKASLGGPECVVTGGLGTIGVEYQGQKYFVCCTGCRDLFLDNPARAIAEYQARKAAEEAERGR